jgi:acetyl-CoA carboxylase biotin carboxyl carrier protein
MTTIKPAEPDGRAFAPTIVLSFEARDDGGGTLHSPAVGLLRDLPLAGTTVRPGAVVAGLDILGAVHRLVAPPEAVGVVRPWEGPRVALRPVGFGDVVCVLDPAVAGAVETVTATREASSHAGLRFVAPLSGRFYARPSPDQAAFVAVGDVVTRGATVGLLEVMKTFHRLVYGGDGLPERARVAAIRPADESDLEEGDPILELEPA